MEVLAVISEAKTSLINKIYHESFSDYRSIHRDIGYLLHNDVRAIRFKMPIDSTNPFSKEYLDDMSIGTFVTEALTDISDAEDNLEVEMI